MEISQPKTRPAYYFSWADQEILEEHILALPCDEDTWLYKVEARYRGQYKHFELGSPFQDQKTAPIGGIVDSRTFTRRKHCALRPSLESVVESPLSNRSSLGVLSASKLLNDTLQCMQTLRLENQETTSSNFIGSEVKPPPHRVFKLDSPFVNSGALGGNRLPSTNYTFERARLNSDASDISVPYSLEHCSLFDKHGQMTDSLINFLKQDVHSQAAHQPESPMAESLISLSENCELGKKYDVMTESMVSFLEPVNCKPPSGFRDNEMTDSVVNVHEVDGLPNCEMTNSVKDYLENIRSNSPALLIKSTASSETENIPPYNCIIGDNYQNTGNSIKEIGNITDQESRKLNSTYDIEANGLYKLEGKGDTTYDLNNKSDESLNVTFTNTVNIKRAHKDKSSLKDEVNTRTLNTTYGKEISSVKELSDNSLIIRALNNKDLNLNDTSKLSRQIPSRNSLFNTTFTKLSETIPKSSNLARSTDVLNGGGAEEDRTSSASDSSFSSDGTKPRSVDELRTIAKQQESSLVQQTSTPTESNMNASKFVDMDIELSPIRRVSMGGRPNESRSANCSPVRSHQQPCSYNHPISRLKQPAAELSRQMFPASSMSNIARPKSSGLRMPMPVSRFNVPQRVESSRPFTAPGSSSVQPPQGIPRPQISRLPMPRFRGSSIPGPRRGCL